MGTDEARKAHVLIVSIAFPGHFAPLMQIIYHLEASHPGTTVTVMGNKDRIADVVKLQRKGDLKGLDLRLEEVFGEVPVFHEDPKFPVRAVFVSENNFAECESLRNKLIANKDVPGGPTAVVADEFQYWSKDLADELGVPWYTYFSTCPMFCLNVMEAPKLVEAGVHPVTSTNLNDLLPSVPGLPYIRIRDLTEEVFRFREFYTNILDRSKRSSAILLNTSEEMEATGGTIIAMRKLLPSSRVLTIGPSLQHPGFGFIYAPTDSKSNCLDWLDFQPAKSVLYIAFGSLGAISEEMVTELAAGVEASGVPFLWVFKLGSRNLNDVLPPGFRERTRDRGLIETGWAPQSKILLHPSIGGFLSHSGWNSTLESLCSGVPLISWPLSADQPMTSRFIANVAKVGFAICEGKEEDRDSFEDISRQAVEKMVRMLMLQEEGREVRKNVEALQKSLEGSVAKGGSSYRNLHTLLDELAGV